jgi:GH18 family chitinase
MAYDGKGPWNRTDAGQHASMEFAKDNVAYWLKRGVPKDRLTLGVPFYGYGFGKAYKRGDYPYAKIVATYPGAENADQAGETIWYNGLPTIRAKAKLAADEGLAGVMIWSLDADAAGEKSLLRGVDEALNGKLK